MANVDNMVTQLTGEVVRVQRLLGNAKTATERYALEALRQAYLSAKEVLAEANDAEAELRGDCPHLFKDTP